MNHRVGNHVMGRDGWHSHQLLGVNILYVIGQRAGGALTSTDGFN